MAKIAALTHSTNCSANLASGPKRIFHCSSTVTTHTPQATAQPITRQT